MKTRTYVLLCLIFMGASMAWGQILPDTDGEPTDDAALATQVQTAVNGPSLAMAMSDLSYPVTPGDVYALGYSSRGQILTQSIPITSDYNMDLGIFGVVNTQGLTYLQLKENVESIISNYYPGSHPMVVLQAPGEFEITLNRPGLGNSRIAAWGLTRLGDTIEEMELEDVYSRRNILITHSDGSRGYYDYYQYLYGDSEEANPLIRPGDQIEFSYNRNRVDISGAVRSPGLKEILPRDTMNDIVRFVGDFQPTADTSRIQKSERIGEEEINTVHEWGDRALFIGNSELISIHVPSASEARSVIYVDINTSQQPQADATPAANLPEITPTDGDEELIGPVVRIEVPAFEGMRVSDVLGRIDSYFTMMSDLKRSYLIRENADGPILINLESIMNSSKIAGNIEVEPGDILGIPSRTVYVTISGAVYNPGRYYYTPMRTAGYYITMAGGIDPEQGSHRNVTVYDEDGNERHEADMIEPGDNIIAVQDNVAFQFNQKFGTVISVLALITSLVTLITVTIAVN